jgi:hypothetical protein
MIDFTSPNFSQWNFILNFLTLLLIVILQGLMLIRLSKSEIQRGEIRQMLAGRSELFYQILTALSAGQPQEIGERIKSVASHFMDDVIVIDCPPEHEKNKEEFSRDSKDNDQNFDQKQ